MALYAVPICLIIYWDNIPLDSFDSPSSTSSSVGSETCSLSPFPQNEQTSAACEPIVPLEPCPQHVQWPEDELSLFGGRLKDVEGDLNVTFVNVSGSENDSSLFFTTIPVIQLFAQLLSKRSWLREARGRGQSREFVQRLHPFNFAILFTEFFSRFCFQLWKSGFHQIRSDRVI